MWLTNEEPVYKYWMEAARAALEAAEGDKEEALYKLAEQIKEELEENAPDLAPGLYSDLLGKSLQEINYREVAQYFLDE